MYSVVGKSHVGRDYCCTRSSNRKEPSFFHGGSPLAVRVRAGRIARARARREGRSSRLTFLEVLERSIKSETDPLVPQKNREREMSKSLRSGKTIYRYQLVSVWSGPTYARNQAARPKSCTRRT